MRLLHIADLHLGAPLAALSDAEKMRQRREELLGSLRRALELGREHGVRAVLLAGDLFDSENVSERVLMHTCELISSYSPLPFFYVTGNHERDVLLSRADKPKNLYTFDSYVFAYNLGDVCIYGTNESSPDMLKNVHPRKETKNILLFHGELRDQSDFGGVMGLSDLAYRGFDYVALGHYHTFSEKKIEGGGVAVYSGVPEGRGFDELGPKGAVIFDTDDTSVRFYPLCKRVYHKIELDIGASDTTESILHSAEKALGECKKEDAVRLVLTGERDLTLQIDHELLRLYLTEHFWYFELIDETRVSDTKEALRFDRSLRGEFLRLVLADETLGEDEKKEIIDCGLLALSGEELSL